MKSSNGVDGNDDGDTSSSINHINGDGDGVEEEDEIKSKLNKIKTKSTEEDNDCDVQQQDNSKKTPINCDNQTCSNNNKIGNRTSGTNNPNNHSKPQQQQQLLCIKQSQTQPSNTTLKSSIKIDFKLINHRLKDIGLDSWTVKRFAKLVTNNFLDQQDLINEITINQLRKLLNEHTILKFLDYLETDTMFKSKTINQLMMKSDPNHMNQCNKMVFWINKWESNNNRIILSNHTSNKSTSSGGGGQFLMPNKFSTNQINESSTCDGGTNPTSSSSYHNHHHNHSLSYWMKNSKRIINFMTPNAIQHRPGPNWNKLMEMLEQKDYILELSNGQRKYTKSSPSQQQQEDSSTSPPIESTTTTTPSNGTNNNSEIFVGKIPKDLFEDELVPLFEQIGPIYNLRLMIDPYTGLSRGYAFITYFKSEHATRAVEKFDNYELINYGVHLKVKMSIPNVRLFIGNICKDMTKEDIRQEFQKHTTGLIDVIVYHSPMDRKRNRGFCFLEFESHKYASQAKRKFLQNHLKIWDSEIWVDWAEPLEQPNEEIMSKVKVLYVRNLSLDMNDLQIKQLFSKFGQIERVKKIKDYAFVHFEKRESALEAMKQMNGFLISSPNQQNQELQLEISLAKPPTDKRRKEEILRNREKRLMNMMMMHSTRYANNNPTTVQTITFVQPAQTIPTAIPHHPQPPPPPPCLMDSLTATAAVAASAPILMNATPSNQTQDPTTICQASQYALQQPQSSIIPNNLPGTVSACIPNYFVGYTTTTAAAVGSQPYPIYHPHQLPPPTRSAVARVTLASHSEDLPHHPHHHSQNSSTHYHHHVVHPHPHLNQPTHLNHHHQISSSSSNKSDNTRLYNETDPIITGY